MTAQKMKFSVKDFFRKCDQIYSFLRIWSHLLKKSLMKNFIFCAVYESLNISRTEHFSSNTKIHAIFINSFMTEVPSYRNQSIDLMQINGLVSL